MVGTARGAVRDARQAVNILADAAARRPYQEQKLRLNLEFVADRAIHRHDVGERIPYRQPHATLLQSANDFFRRNVSDEHVLREWASAQSTNGRVEAPAPSLVRS